MLWSMSSTGKSDNARPSVFVPVSIGELVDKVTILGIKREQIRNPDKRACVCQEYEQLMAAMREAGITQAAPAFRQLREINLELWQLENAIRDKERQRRFDDEFIQIARRIYQRNDTRGELKKAINVEYGSGLTEEKEYTVY